MIVCTIQCSRRWFSTGPLTLITSWIRWWHIIIIVSITSLVICCSMWWVSACVARWAARVTRRCGCRRWLETCWSRRRCTCLMTWRLCRWTRVMLLSFCLNVTTSSACAHSLAHHSINETTSSTQHTANSLHTTSHYITVLYHHYNQLLTQSCTDLSLGYSGWAKNWPFFLSFSVLYMTDWQYSNHQSYAR